MPDRELGRRVLHDERDHRYMLAEIRRLTTERTYRYWSAGFDVDQTGPSCTANGTTHALGDAPRRRSLADLTAVAAPGAGLSVSQLAAYRSAQSGQDGVRGYVYDRAQATDPFPDTPPEGGSSVRAAAEAWRSLGVISEYRWLVPSDSADVNMDDIYAALFEEGAVVIGVPIYEGMIYEPNGRPLPGGSWMQPTGEIAGGHCMTLRGGNKAGREPKVQIQSWGLHFWLEATVLRELLADEGEACVLVETPA